MKKILFFTCEPGGAEILIPIINNMLKDKDFSITILGYGYALDRLKKHNIDYNQIKPIEINDFSILELYKPDYIITSATSLPQKDMSEKYLWYNAKQKNIPTIAFLDQWQNYSIRFSGVYENEKLSYQPDFINCINDIGKKDMIGEGFDANKLIEFGHPYLSSLQEIKIDKQFILNELNLSNEKNTVLFVSEAIMENYGVSRGYTQYNTIDYFLKNNEFLKDKQVIIKLHPKDEISKFKEYQNLILIKNEYSSLEMISIADYIIGMTSIMLIEAYILKKNVLSIQLNSNEDLLLLSKEKKISKVTTDTHKIIKNDFVKNGDFFYKFEYEIFKEFLLNETNN